MTKQIMKILSRVDIRNAWKRWNLGVFLYKQVEERLYNVSRNYVHIISRMDRELEHDILNDLNIREAYIKLREYIKMKDVNAIEAMKIWAEHCMEESKFLF